ncbi:uncharacterized protein P174DRAFT_420448 [Aspergillus novofumigatus IBT 16806]|uniref:COX assembly mitochondrial protein n=1 Tax=Aspergillus novofumigatus (strain IBT 16806) TaxID=1392255 RepID=A0A2I1C8A9_ASPN1|nr:uncharacterized protein P174DRAFT_420448 [Aspergillus novofumigatus IBT 16806]PKX93870.1 hypothetical protein P174DRAFT_420448 [Aspergillus novofumigatus IBT 16806]
MVEVEEATSYAGYDYDHNYDYDSAPAFHSSIHTRACSIGLVLRRREFLKPVIDTTVHQQTNRSRPASEASASASISIMASTSASTTAAAQSSTSSPTPQPQSTRKYNLHNPLPLSAAQEAEVKQLYYKRVRAHCAPEIKAFAECAVNRTVTATWVCRAQRLAMNSCMVAHAKPEEEDRAREEWFATHEERRRAREEELARVEKRREEVIRMMREDEARRKKSS